MKKKFIIPMVMALLFGVVIVNTMADPSGIVPQKHRGDQLVSAGSVGLAVSLDKPADASVLNSEGANGTALLSMLMIGLALVGLASIREGNQELGADRAQSNIKNKKMGDIPS